MTNILVNADGIVVKRRAKAVLDGASIRLERNEVVALIGDNGAGKTTLFNVIAGYLIPDRGKIIRNCQRDRIALLADKPALYPDWPVSEALQRLAGLYRCDSAQIEALISEFGLAPVMAQQAKNLSHGYCQRLAMAQMLLSGPEVMLLDEPGNGLDYRQRRALWPLLADLKHRGSVILISHDWLEVGAVADRVYLLKNGLCHELDLPQRNPDWKWLGFADTISAAAYPYALCCDGRFVAITAGNSDYPEQVLTVHDGYPAQALQEKIDALV